MDGFSKAIAVGTAFVTIAWQEPLIYVGFSLLLHNWIAYFYWILSSQDQKRRATALLSTLLFFAIHYLILAGHLDAWIPKSLDQEALGTGWYLASWSSDPLVWYRFLITYVFGLSMHYFIWLKAIPESMSKAQHPISFRATLANLRKELGSLTVSLCFGLLLLAYGVWIYTPILGTRVYFELAILDGKIEIMFLIKKFVLQSTGKNYKLVS